MATRNRTPLYRKYRDALRSVRTPAATSSSSAAPSPSGGPVIEMVSTSLLHQNRSYAPLSTEDPSNSRGAFAAGLPPAWVDDSEEVAANMQRARTKMGELVKAHTKALMPSFGDSREDQHKIEVLTQEITDLLKKSEKRLLKLSASGHSEDSNVRKNVQRSLATDLQSLSMELRKKQSTYLKRLRQQKEGQDGVDLEMNLNGSKSKQEDDDFADVTMRSSILDIRRHLLEKHYSGCTHSSDNLIRITGIILDSIRKFEKAAKHGFNEYQMSRLKKSEAFTAEREREINQIVESVNDLAQIMKDLSVLIIDQGTIVDRIDYNIQNVASSVEEGFKQLQKAERNQKKGGMVMCATVLVILCFIMLVLLILKAIIL